MKTTNILPFFLLLFGSTSLFSQSNRFLDFDGDDDEVRVPVNPIINAATTKLTAELWINPASRSTRDGLIGIWGDFNVFQSSAWELRISADANLTDEIEIFVQDGSLNNPNAQPYWITTNADLVDGNWQHIAFVFDDAQQQPADRVKIYKNGVPVRA